MATRDVPRETRNSWSEPEHFILTCAGLCDEGVSSFPNSLVFGSHNGRPLGGLDPYSDIVIQLAVPSPSKSSSLRTKSKSGGGEREDSCGTFVSALRDSSSAFVRREHGLCTAHIANLGKIISGNPAFGSTA